ncbi:MAG TPA: UDP-N-acetylglucosamine 2-epimerase (non-hydrolyzing) [Chlamydiales bacterium]|nr:UDP-N-acetylglucosamine 2-epimerase (non-hydrolyzing) [Chlamydiales bacterium]
MKVLVVCGTRPEVIKLAPIILRAKQQREEVDLAVCATGQHREMQQQAFVSFSIAPDFSLEVMEVDQSLVRLSGKLMQGLDKTITFYQPDWVLVQGDTMSALMGALAASYHGVKVGHVEAGLRTYDTKSPFPEELNRQLLSKLATLHFAPTALAAANLRNEGISESQVRITGNTVVDAIEMITAPWRQMQPKLPMEISSFLSPGEANIFVTCHRRENIGPPLVAICAGLRCLCKKYPRCRWIFSVHLNPSVREIVFRELQDITNMILIDPLDYETMLNLLSKVNLVMTDSGGLQEEAPSFSVPVVVMRNHTERSEGVYGGFATLAGTQPDQIVAAASRYLDAPEEQKRLLNRENPYGDAKASLRILNGLLGKKEGDFRG